ncbi:hypothetical protein PR048_025674 [Dryococelus australis]|uniref:Uncharacterized protein n=1 Tax=Dryococelus australis TaxID=614101 RepID=A0ABQ9GJ66_9NEOP|nr:hypothetical protein PR048_025674 [Dryococelus australis]
MALLLLLLLATVGSHVFRLSTRPTLRPFEWVTANLHSADPEIDVPHGCLDFFKSIIDAVVVLFIQHHCPHWRSGHWCLPCWLHRAKASCMIVVKAGRDDHLVPPQGIPPETGVTASQCPATVLAVVRLVAVCGFAVGHGGHVVGIGRRIAAPKPTSVEYSSRFCSGRDCSVLSAGSLSIVARQYARCSGGSSKPKDCLDVRAVAFDGRVPWRSDAGHLSATWLNGGGGTILLTNSNGDLKTKILDSCWRVGANHGLSHHSRMRYQLHHDGSVIALLIINVLKDCFFLPSPHLAVENAEEMHASRWRAQLFRMRPGTCRSPRAAVRRRPSQGQKTSCCWWCCRRHSPRGGVIPGRERVQSGLPPESGAVFVGVSHRGETPACCGLKLLRILSRPAPRRAPIGERRPYTWLTNAAVWKIISPLGISELAARSLEASKPSETFLLCAALWICWCCGVFSALSPTHSTDVLSDSHLMTEEVVSKYEQCCKAATDRQLPSYASGPCRVDIGVYLTNTVQVPVDQDRPRQVRIVLLCAKVLCNLTIWTPTFGHLSSCIMSRGLATSRLQRYRWRRLDWCRNHEAWSDGEWRRVMFSDDSQFCITADDDMCAIITTRKGVGTLTSAWLLAKQCGEPLGLSSDHLTLPHLPARRFGRNAAFYARVTIARVIRIQLSGIRLCPNSHEVHTCAYLSPEVLSELQVNLCRRRMAGVESSRDLNPTLGRKCRLAGSCTVSLLGHDVTCQLHRCDVVQLTGTLQYCMFESSRFTSLGTKMLPFEVAIVESKQAVFDGKKPIRGGIPFVFRKKMDKVSVLRHQQLFLGLGVTRHVCFAVGTNDCFVMLINWVLIANTSIYNMSTVYEKVIIFTTTRCSTRMHAK